MQDMGVMVQREATNKKTGETSCEIAYGITSRTPDQKPIQNAPSPSIGATGPLKIAAVISSIGTTTKIAAVYESAMGRKISPVDADSSSVSSNPKAFAA
jgi:hypothetical protein